MDKIIYRLCLDCNEPIYVHYVKRCATCRKLNMIKLRNKHNQINNIKLKDKIKEYQKIRRLNRTEEEIIKAREYNKEWYRIHSNYYSRIRTRKPTKLSAHEAYLRRKEKGLINPKRREYMKIPKNKIINNLRCRVWGAIRRISKNNVKYYTFNEYIGCSPDYFIKYIESKLKPGMTLNNYSIKTWHLDHIIPCSSFDLSIPEEQKKCFHYSNIQPLWAEENYRKSNKIN